MGNMTPTRALVWRREPHEIYRTGRTLRSLTAAGFQPEDLGQCSPEQLRKLFAAADRPLLFVRGGNWLTHAGKLPLPSSSATGRGLCALGIVRSTASPVADEVTRLVNSNNPSRAASRNPPSHPNHSQAFALASDTNFASLNPEAARWAALLSQTGGDFNLLRGLGENEPPAPPIAYFDLPAVRWLAEQGIGSLDDLLRSGADGLRIVHVPALDVFADDRLRVMQVITGLQRGGAERLTLDLLEQLPAQGVASRLATLGQSLREAFPTPPGTLDLSHARSASARSEQLVREAIAFGADVLHAHLVKAEEITRWSHSGIPVVQTVHNTQAGWPAGMAGLRAEHTALLAACSRAVEAELKLAELPIPVRTIWNGINPSAYSPTGRLAGMALMRRRDWGFGEDDFLLVSVANPRPQKRLHLLPGILAELRAKLGTRRQARLILCGEPQPGNAAAAESITRTNAEARRLGVSEHLRWIGSSSDVAEILAASDAFVSTSAHEGLSLAQLEALASGLTVVVTNVGGAAEVAGTVSRMRLLSADAEPAEFAKELYDLATSPDDARIRKNGLGPAWTAETMAARYRWLYQRAIAAKPAPRAGEGIWLVTNNFSTGGAQSSARRLLQEFAQRGIKVRAAVVEEDPANPTPGRQKLTQAGIPVIAIPPTIGAGTSVAVESILAAIDADPPEAILFWNLRPSYKVLLADALLNVPVYDVSPGEMFFSSFAAYFAKPPSGFPYRSARDYGERLAGAIVKYHAEAARAAETLGAPVRVIPNGVPLPSVAAEVTRLIHSNYPQQPNSQPIASDPNRSTALPLPSCRAEASSRRRMAEGRGEGDSRSIAIRRSIIDGAFKDLSSNSPLSSSQPSSSPARVLQLGTAARINPQKRLEDLLEALRLAHDRLPPYTLRIAGGVERNCEAYAESLRQLATGLPVEWLGDVSDIASFHQSLDFFVAISEPAGCPNASLEAIAAGLPIIATDFGGASEQIVEAQNGYLVPPRDPVALSESILKLACQPDRWPAMATAGRQLIAERFSMDRMVSEYARFCLGAVRRKSDSASQPERAEENGPPACSRNRSEFIGGHPV